MLFPEYIDPYEKTPYTFVVNSHIPPPLPQLLATTNLCSTLYICLLQKFYVNGNVECIYFCG